MLKSIIWDSIIHWNHKLLLSSKPIGLEIVNMKHHFKWKVNYTDWGGCKSPFA